MTPLGLCAGKTTLLVLEGTHLEGLTGLSSTFPISSSAVVSTAAATQAIFRVTLAKGVPPGPGAFRAIGSNGVSELRLIWIDPLEATAWAPTNRGRENALLVTSPALIDAAVPKLGYDFYRFQVSAGQTILAEVVAQRIGSKLDPILRLLDSSGRELEYADDTPGIAPDARIRFTARQPGDYFLEVRDVEYGGGPGYHYRLRTGEVTAVALPFPLVGRRGERSQFFASGDGSAGPISVTLRLPATGDVTTVSIPQHVRGRAPTAAAICLSDLPQLIESEPNDEPGQAPLLEVPGGVNGRFDHPRDRDYYRVKAAKGQRLTIRGKTRSLGSPCDLFLEVRTSGGTNLANPNAGLLSETNLTYTFAEEGEYFLKIEELSGGAGFPYYFEVQPFQPGFELFADLVTTNTQPGGTIEAKVTAVRSDYAGRIKLFVEGLGPAVLLDNDAIAEGKTETPLKITVPFATPPGLYFCRVLGRASVNQGDYQAAAATWPALQRLFPRVVHPTRGLDGSIALGVAGARVGSLK